MTVALWAVFAFLLVRIEHLGAGVVWLLRRGPDCYGSKQWRKARNDYERWQAYKRFGGGRLPWLFLGMRAHRLRASENGRYPVSQRRLPIAWAALGLRLVWIYPMVGLVVPPLLIILSESTDASTSSALLACAFLLVTGSLILAVEGGVCLVLFGSWGDTHHRGLTKSRRMREARAIGGSIVVALLATVTLIWIAARRFGSFPTLADHGGLGQRLADAMQGAIAFMFQNPPNEVSGPVGDYSILALRMLWAAYLVALLTLFGWAARSNSPN